MKYHTLGTKHESYLKRLDAKYITHEFSINKIDSHSFIIMSKEGVKIDTFTSSTTLNQFLLVLKAFNLIKVKASSYLIINKNPSIDEMTTAIFEKSADKDITSYRNSRIITLLVSLNLLNNDMIKKLKLSGKRGPFKIVSCKGEASSWEKAIMNNMKKLSEVIERITNEYKI